MRVNLLVFGSGYTASAIAAGAARAGHAVALATRHPEAAAPPPGVALQPFLRPDLEHVTHLLLTAAPSPADPVLSAHRAALAAAPALRWVGYLSSTGVYGDRAGAWVDETAIPAPANPRSEARLAAEQGWAALSPRLAIDLFRLAGIYGPGRSPFAAIRAGTARRILKPGHAFSRIHRDDIAGAVLAALAGSPAPGRRVLHLADDHPAENAAVLEEAARLLGLPPPAAIPFAEASLSPMARSFWSENRRVAAARTQTMLGYRWRYPSYVEGLRATLEEEESK